MKKMVKISGWKYINQLEQLAKIFQETNQQINLSAIRDLEWIQVKHIQDSLELNKVITLEKGSKFCDIGTGWGFPLLPLAITHQDIAFTGIDARKKKIEVIQSFCEKLKLKNVKLLWGRIEEFIQKDKKHKESFDYISARAVGYVDKLFSRSYPLLKKWGAYILYKQENQEEYNDLKKLCKKYQLKIKKEHYYQLFTWDIQRVIYIVEKL